MVYVLLAEGFEEMEALVPVDLLRRAGIETRLVSLGGPVVTGSHGIAVQADLLLEQAELEGMEMLVLPGGKAGVDAMHENLPAQAFIQAAHMQGQWIAAICAAPTLLAQLGILDRRNSVCFPGMEADMGSAALRPEREVVVDGRIVTARAAGSAFEFGFMLIALLAGEEKAKEVRNGTYYRYGESGSEG